MMAALFSMALVVGACDNSAEEAPSEPDEPGTQQEYGGDPGGKPCTDQSGAPGHYVPNDDSTGWICQITGDAPRR
jgi:hypothetical protein